MYNLNEVKEATLKYFKGDSLAADTWVSKYCLKDSDGNYLELTPDDMHIRLAKNFSKYDPKMYNEILELFRNFRFIIPQGSVMEGLGNPFRLLSLSNCFVIGQPLDSYSGILHKDQELVQLMKRRGGVGIDISSLRPRGSNTTNAARTSSGAASFMHRFSNSTREVGQDGRRGALMLTMNCHHPDILEFINAKRNTDKVTGANVSVMVTDDLVESIINSTKDTLFDLRFPVDDPSAVVTTAKGKDIWDQIIECAWQSAEPGCIFIDRMIKYSPDGIYPAFRGISTNPCGEIFMPAYDSCRLLVANPFYCVLNPFTKDAKFDFEAWKYITEKAMFLSDVLVDLELEAVTSIINKIESDPEPNEIKSIELNLWRKIFDIGAKGRRTGTGITAVGDTLAALGIGYGSKESLDFLKQLMIVKMKSELKISIELAKKICPFTGWDSKLELEASEDPESFYYTIRNVFPEEWKDMQKYGRRNVSWSTVAPTGTLSIMTQTTSGIEPLFKPYYTRRKKINHNDEKSRVDFTDNSGDKWQEYAVIHPQLIEWCKSKNKKHTREFLEELPIDEIDALYKKSPWFKSTANEIDWIKRVEIQAIIQKYISHSISSTINLPNDVTKEKIDEIYVHAFKMGLKGITVYRDGCRSGVLVDKSEKQISFGPHDAPKRPKSLACDIHTVTANGERFLVIIGLMDNKPYEVFAHHVPKYYRFNTTKGFVVKYGKGEYVIEDKDGNTLLADLGFPRVNVMSPEEAALTRLISMALRHGAKLKYIVEQLEKVDGNIVSFSKAIVRTLKSYLEETDVLAKLNQCPSCYGYNMAIESGCPTCKDCGYGKC